jgi:phenylacetate-CoA ligase
MVKQVKKRVKDVIGVSVGVDVVEPNGIERSIGKAKRVVDNRPK